MAAKRHIPRRLFYLKADLGFQSLPISINESNQADRGPANVRGQDREVIEQRFRRGIEYLVAMERFQPFLFVVWDRRGDHGFSGAR